MSSPTQKIVKAVYNKPTYGVVGSIVQTFGVVGIVLSKFDDWHLSECFVQTQAAELKDLGQSCSRPQRWLTTDKVYRITDQQCGVGDIRVSLPKVIDERNIPGFPPIQKQVNLILPSYSQYDSRLIILWTIKVYGSRLTILWTYMVPVYDQPGTIKKATFMVPA